MTEIDTAVPVLKLRETHDDAIEEMNDQMSMFRIWMLLTGGAQTRDLTVMNRQVL